MAIIEKLFPTARERLVMLGGDAHVTEAAALLGDRKHHLVVVCGAAGEMLGVVARRDVVREVSHCLGCACTMACREIMTTEVVTCHPQDPLQRVWDAMVERGLRSVPILDAERRPLGVATARDMAAIMLSEAEYDREAMTEYVMSVGYR